MSVSPIDVAWLINSTVDDLEACMKENDKLRDQLANQPKPATDDHLFDPKVWTGKPASGEGVTEEKRLRIRLAQVEQQLAAEQDAKLGWRKIAERQTTDAEQLREQLAAEKKQCRDQLAPWVKSEELLRDQIVVLVDALTWLDEFVVEPEYFPGDGDQQWWQEKRDSIRTLATLTNERKVGEKHDESNR